MPGKVVLFFPSYYSDEAAPPLALIHLAAPLVERGYEVRIVDSAVTPDCVADGAARGCEGALCLGISMVTGPMITQGVEVAQAVRARFPALPVVAGGWHASILPEQTLRSPLVDAVVKGQGELTFLEIVERYARGRARPRRASRAASTSRTARSCWNADRGYTDINALPRRPFQLVDFEAYARKCGGAALDPLLHLARLPLGLLVLLERVRLRPQLEAAACRRRRSPRWRELARRATGSR